jgi:anti-anti-sigma factor
MGHGDRPRPVRVRVVLSGELDLAARDRVLVALDALLSHAPSVIEIDTTGVRFIDCAGVSALVQGALAAQRGGNQIFVSQMSPVVERLLELTGTLAALGPESGASVV